MTGFVDGSTELPPDAADQMGRKWGLEPAWEQRMRRVSEGFLARARRSLSRP